MVDVINALTDALYAALYRDLSEIEDTKYLSWKKREAGETPETYLRRPYKREVEVYSFPETWGSTALGYGGVGGHAMTTAQAVIITCPITAEACIYWGAGGYLGRKLNLSDTQDSKTLQKILSTNSTQTSF